MEINDEENAERALEVAEKIKQLNTICIILGLYDDIDFLREAARDTLEQKNRMESALVLIRKYNPEQGEVLRLQAAALNSLADFLEGQKRISFAKELAAEYDRDRIDRIFGL